MHATKLHCGQSHVTTLVPGNVVQCLVTHNEESLQHLRSDYYVDCGPLGSGFVSAQTS